MRLVQKTIKVLVVHIAEMQDAERLFVSPRKSGGIRIICDTNKKNDDLKK